MHAPVIGVLLALALTVVSGQVNATPAEVEALAGEAQSAYKKGQYVEAIEIYRRAWQVGGDAALLYNIALIYDRKIEDHELARQYFRRYLAAPDAEPSVASRAQVRLRQMRIEEDAAQQRKNDARHAAQEADRVRAKKAAAEREQPIVNEPSKTQKRRKPSSEGNGLRTTGIIFSGLGLATIGGGVFFGVLADRTEGDFTQSQNLAQKKTLRADGQGQALTADVLYGVGGLTLATGILMWWLAPSASTQISAGPTADGTGSAIWIGGSL